MNFYDKIGKIALGSRLRRLSEMITEDAARLYELYGVGLQPKWFPVFYALSEGAQKSITAIAIEIGHSHPSVSKIIREMSTHGLITGMKDRKDGRRNNVKLSRKGNLIVERIRDQYTDVGAALEEAFGETQYDLWKAIAEWEFLLEQKSLFRRVTEQKKRRESRGVTIVDYTVKYRDAFRKLNEEWIKTYFTMEAEDHKALDHPKQYILDKGGHIFIALYQGKPVGTCALLTAPGKTFELAKMAVAPSARGKNIGWLLGRASIEKAKALGAERLYLESNTILKPAISLYYKLGFKKVTGPPSPYARSNIQMELRVD